MSGQTPPPGESPWNSTVSRRLPGNSGSSCFWCRRSRWHSGSDAPRFLRCTHAAVRPAHRVSSQKRWDSALQSRSPLSNKCILSDAFRCQNDSLQGLQSVVRSLIYAPQKTPFTKPQVPYVLSQHDSVHKIQAAHFRMPYLGRFG